MSFIHLPSQIARQPQYPALVNLSTPFGARRWACIHILGKKPYGYANPVATIGGSCKISHGQPGGRLETPPSAADGSIMSYGANAKMQLSKSTGLIVFDIPQAVRYSLFSTNGASNAFTVQSEGLPTIYPAITCENVALLASPPVPITVNTVYAIAWSYNNETGLARAAVAGVLNKRINLANFSHGTVQLGRGNQTYNQGPSNIYLLALSPDECLSDSALVEMSLRPWSLFQPLEKRIYFMPAGTIKTRNGIAWGGVKTLDGVAAGSVKAINGVAAQ